ncbi:HNH endonuclease family protein [Streptomyces bathyalis]|uniref:HNH endonuclease family protein n=1 Tax=Streptomyces bathyalis TaxID=2710756 RepID=UPI003CCE374A
MDIDHLVPLAEAWDSGASKWSPTEREHYANDLEAERSLVAVTLSTNRSKGDQDPAEWLPPAASTHCLYATDWVQTELRWKLAADAAERSELQHLADDCPDATVTPSPAP